MRLPDAGRPDQEHAAVRLHEAPAGEGREFRFGQFRIVGPIEFTETLGAGDPGLLQPARVEAVGAAHKLVLDEQFEKLEMGQRGGFGLRDAPGERVDHAGESEVPQAGGELDGHARISGRAYCVMGRMRGSTARRAGARGEKCARAGARPG